MNPNRLRLKELVKDINQNSLSRLTWSTEKLLKFKAEQSENIFSEFPNEPLLELNVLRIETLEMHSKQNNKLFSLTSKVCENVSDSDLKVHLKNIIFEANELISSGYILKKILSEKFEALKNQNLSKEHDLFGILKEMNQKEEMSAVWAQIKNTEQFINSVQNFIDRLVSFMDSEKLI